MARVSPIVNPRNVKQDSARCRTKVEEAARQSHDGEPPALLLKRPTKEEGAATLIAVAGKLMLVYDAGKG